MDKTIFNLKTFFMIALQMIILVNAQGIINPNVGSIAGLKISEGAYYYPYPAEPGRYVDVYIKVQSIATSTIENLTCYLDPAFPFSLDNPSDGIYNLGSFKQKDIALMKFKIRVNENAVTGTNKLKIICKAAGYAEETAELNIYVQSHDAVLIVKEVTSVPSEFKPNQIGNVYIKIENVAGCLLKDITIKLDLSSENIPFVPVNGTTEKRIQLLENGRSEIINFTIKSMADAAAKSYKIPLQITYYDALGKSYSKSTIISLDVITEPALLVLHDQTNIVKNNYKNVIPISVINRGESKIAFATVYFLNPSTSEYVLLSPDTYYIGDINSDDSEVAEFEVFVNTSEKHLILPIKIVYKDAVGNIHEQKEDVKVNVFSKEDAIKYGYEKQVATDPIIIGIAIIIVAYILFRYVLPSFKKKKKTEFNE